MDDAKKMLEKTKKNWVPMTLGDKEAGDQDVRQRQDMFYHITRWAAGRSDFY